MPIEVSRFGLEATRRAILRAAEACGIDGDIVPRKMASGEAFTTDSGNYLVDCVFGAIPAPEELAHRLSAIPGIIEHGLFIGLATAVVMAGPEEIKIFGQLN